MLLAERVLDLPADGVDGVEPRRAGKEEVEQALQRHVLRLGGVSLAVLFLDEVASQLSQIADQALDVPPDVTNLGELAGLDLDEGAIGEAGKPSGDLGFADPGGPDHDDVFGRNLIAHLFGKLLAPPPVAQGDGDGPLGVPLADDVAVELFDDALWGQIFHQSTSTEMWLFV